MSTAKEYKQAYVFACNPSGQPCLVGTMKISPRGGEFQYSDSWYHQPWAYALDPVNLPLSLKTYTTTNRKRVFGVLLDAAPDAWGERVQLMAHESSPKNELEKLIRLSGTGVGSIEFSLSQTRPKKPKPLPNIELLDALSEAVEHIAENSALSKEELRLVEPGSSMGGARPKITLTDEEGYAWLVKFSRGDDVISYPKVEYASMSLLAATGVNVPEVRLKRISNGKYCYLIKRFDKEKNTGIHFISANALFNVDRLRIYDDSRADPAGYIALARILRKISAQPNSDCIELFKRMVYSILIGGTDDHARNHAMIFNVSTGQWRLSPAYDVLPIVGSQGEQSMGVGVLGRESSIENAVSAAPDFGIHTDEALTITRELISKLSGWHAHFETAGVDAGDLQILSKIINNNLEKASRWIANQ